MNIFAHFDSRFQEAGRSLKEAGILSGDADLAAMTVEPPRDASHGDIASNAAMVLAKQAKLAPRDLAPHFIARLEADPDIERLEIAGPGFINITLRRGFWPAHAQIVLDEGEAYRRFGPRRRREGQRRICLRQPDRADACGPYTGRSVRRRAGESS